MALKTRYVVVNYNPTTKEMVSVYATKDDLTKEQVTKSCEDLNPIDPKFVRHRVGVLVVEEP